MTASLPPSLYPDQVRGSGDLSPAGSRGRAPGLPSRRAARKSRATVAELQAPAAEGVGGTCVAGHDHGLADRQAAQAGEHVRLRCGVQVVGWLIEQQQRGVLEKGAGDGDALGLAAREAVAAFADARVQA